METYRLDRTAFAIQSFEEAAHRRNYWLAHTPQERLAAAWYLICSAYNLDRTKLHRLDRTAFAMRKQAGSNKKLFLKSHRFNICIHDLNYAV